MKPSLAIGAAVLVAACASTAPVAPCACVVIPDLNGLTSLALDGRALAFAGGEPTMAITGGLYAASDYQTETNLVLDGSGFGLAASWGANPAADLTVPAALTDLGYLRVIAHGDLAESESLTLGPRGGTLTLREIAPRPEGGYRVRGSFSGQVCLDAEAGTGCMPAAGNFAFDAGVLPAGAAGLMVES